MLKKLTAFAILLTVASLVVIYVVDAHLRKSIPSYTNSITRDLNGIMNEFNKCDPSLDGVPCSGVAGNLELCERTTISGGCRVFVGGSYSATHINPLIWVPIKISEEDMISNTSARRVVCEYYQRSKGKLLPVRSI